MPLERMYLETSWKWYLIIDKHNCWDYTNNLIWINKLFIQPIQNICTCTLVECQERSPWNYLWIIPYLGEIQMKSPHMYCGMSMIFLPFLAPPGNSILSNHMLNTGFGISQFVFLEKDSIPNTYFETLFLLWLRARKVLWESWFKVGG